MHRGAAIGVAVGRVSRLGGAGAARTAVARTQAVARGIESTVGRHIYRDGWLRRCQSDGVGTVFAYSDLVCCGVSQVPVPSLSRGPVCPLIFLLQVTFRGVWQIRLFPNQVGLLRGGVEACEYISYLYDPSRPGNNYTHALHGVPG